MCLVRYWGNLRNNVPVYRNIVTESVTAPGVRELRYQIWVAIVNINMRKLTEKTKFKQATQTVYTGSYIVYLCSICLGCMYNYVDVYAAMYYFT
jgi:hypothetical protein